MGYVIIVDKTSKRCPECRCILKYGHGIVLEGEGWRYCSRRKMNETEGSKKES